jgi:hypothetical protein
LISIYYWFLIDFGSTGIFFNDLHEYSLASENWTALNQDNRSLGPSPRSEFGFVAAGNKLYLFGGNSPEGIHHIATPVQSL